MLSGTGQIYGRSRLRLAENAMFKIWNDMFMLGIEAQQVAFLRAMKIAAGGKSGAFDVGEANLERIAVSARRVRR